LRQSDQLGRWGGEEFLVLLPGCGDAEAVATVERLRVATAAEALRVNDDLALTLTVSAGVSATENGSVRLEELLHQADEALYRAKSSGRNRVCVHGGGEEPARE
jgi:diguanylate cyclase (GGDEF)-like protein